MAAMAVLSACETIKLQDNVSPEDGVSGVDTEKTQIFTATLGADTKVYLDYDSEQNVYKTVWHEGDFIYVIDLEDNEWEQCYLVEGAGTTTGMFAGTIEADKYVAFYGNAVSIDDGLSIVLPEYQYCLTDWDDKTQSEQTRFDRNVFPMVAESTTTEFAFQNLASVLKVNITGNGEHLTGLRIRTNDENTYVAGRAQVVLNTDIPSIEFESEGITTLYYNVWQQLGPAPKELYIVLPAQTYEGGLTFEFETQNSKMVVNVTEDIELRRSRIRNMNIDYNPTSWNVPEEEWAVWFNSGEEVPMTFENGYMVARNLYLDGYFMFRNVSSDYYLSMSYDYVDYFYQCTPLNTAVQLGYEPYYMTTIVSTNFDIYLDIYNDKCFIMEPGVTPDDIPTKEEVLGWDYWRLSEKSNGSLVKVQGRVMARTTNGFILALDNYINHMVFVYDPYGGLADVDVNQYIDLYAEKITYRYLPELKYSAENHWYFIQGRYTSNLNQSARIITEDFDNYNSDKYEYVGFVGTLEQNGSYYNVYVDGATIIGDIENPVQDLSAYNNQKVYVEGYYLGKNSDSHGNQYLNIALTKISTLDNEGSTNDVLPGDDITVTY